MDERTGPWTPEETEPEEGWPAAPDAVPVVVQAWALMGTGETRPDLPTTGGFGVSLKRDWSALRAGRFAEAWRALRREGATSATVERLHRANMLAPIKGR